MNGEVEMEKPNITNMILATSLLGFGVETNLHAIEAEIGHVLPSGAAWNVASSVASTGSTSWIGHLTAYPSAMTEAVYAGVADEHLLKQGGGLQNWPRRA
jgi:hypothetical protein